MMKKLLFALLVFLCQFGYAQHMYLKLWYNKPAGNNWNAALPIGNGRLGAMIYGNTENEVIGLNESSIWSGGPYRNDNPEARNALPEIRKMIFDGRYDEAENLAGEKIQSPRNGITFYQTAGSLKLTFPGHDSLRVSSYRRELDLNRAVAVTSYVVGGIRYTRETLASIADQVIVIRLTASQPASLTFSLGLSSPLRSSVKVNNSGEVTLSGAGSGYQEIAGAIRFSSIARVLLKGGAMQTSDTLLHVVRADTATIYLSIATNFINYANVNGDEVKKAANLLNSAAGKTYDMLLKRHTQTYRRYFDRVKLNLTQNYVDHEKPTDERIRDFANYEDPGLITLLYQYGRYLLISSSQPGGQPANLQGIWNDQLKPKYGSKYTININTEMNYWAAEETNLSEMHEPLFKMIADLSVTGKQTADKMYGAAGWVAHHNTDLWRVTGPVDGVFYGLWPMGGAWLCQHLWERYRYTGDIAFLRTAYPILKGASQFVLDFLVREPKHGWLIIAPSMSPENATASHPKSSIGAGVTLDNELCYDLLGHTIEAARTLHTDKELIAKLETVKKQLPPLQIGRYGQLQEWLDDLDDPNDHNRHVSHLFALYPGNQISVYHTPQLAQAVRTALMARGDQSNGWSTAWKINLWARLLDGEHAYKLLKQRFVLANNALRGPGGTYPNLLNAHPPFQIDGNFGIVAGITEMLMQSHDGAIHLLPALPNAWESGFISGLKARGGFEIVEMRWHDRKITSLKIRSTLGGNCRLRLPNQLKLISNGSIRPAKGYNTNNFYQPVPATSFLSVKSIEALSPLQPTRLYDFETQKGHLYQFTN